MAAEPIFTERLVPREQGTIHVRDYAGAEPAFVLMHGFPDNQHIYDDLIPHLVAGGRRVVTFDFLGFGASEKRPGATYSFAQQRGDLEAVIDHLDLRPVVLVTHDASGMAGVNYAIAHPGKVASLCILNSAYDMSPVSVWPEMIVLFAEPRLQALATGIAGSPEVFGWLLAWQREKFAAALPASQERHFRAFMGPLIANNFTEQPSSGPAFMQLTAEFYEEMTRNSARLPLAAALDVPVRVIWGEYDPYLGASLGRELASHFAHGSYHPIPAGHWLQSDEPELVARALLA